MKRLLIVAVIGGLLGLIGSKYIFVGSFLSLLPWSLVGLSIGIYAKNKKEAIVNGAVYGFLLVFVFMITGYTGNRSLIMMVIPFALLGLFGLACGIFLGVIGFWFKGFWERKKK